MIGNELDRKRLEQLHAMGFALHWCQPKSKRPIGRGWSKAPVSSWKNFIGNAPKGANVGVRLGKASRIADRGYLAVIDCDMKSDQPRHQTEMTETLSRILKDTEAAPKALSGRGQGSCHLYVVTGKPARPRLLARSSDLVRVAMPSVQASERDRRTLSESDLKNGIKIRPAWEISLLGEGQQVVLPPSVHPDSGKAYEWVNFPTHAKSIPTFGDRGESVGENAGKDECAERLGAFQPVKVDLISSRLSDETINMIVFGVGVTDRSGALMTVCARMLKAGFNDQEILSVLTDRENYLGETGFDHTQSRDRTRAANWVARYTLAPCRQKIDASREFGEWVAIEPIPLKHKAAIDQVNEIAPAPDDWRDLLERTGNGSGPPKGSLKNILIVLANAVGKDVFRFDEFANSESYGRDTPWGGKKGKEVLPIDLVRIKAWLSHEFRFEPPVDRINEAVSKIADLNRFHPVRDWLLTLTWDGVQRVDGFLRDYFQAEGEGLYVSAVSRKLLTAMVKRVMEPGCKFDQVVILEGEQGIGKSTALRALAGDEWFTDATLNVTDKDSVMTMRAIWLVEIGELGSLRSAEAEQIKEFVSRTTDRVRVPYGRRAENFPRQCVFVGTTNRDEYLKDPTGNRRFWPVKVGQCDFERVRRDRDQLFAEAMICYREGEPLYLECPKMARAARMEQGARAITDPWEDRLAEWIDHQQAEKNLNGNFYITMDDLFRDGGPLMEWKSNMPEVKRAGDSLRKLGYQKAVRRVEGRNKKCWVPGLPL